MKPVIIQLKRSDIERICGESFESFEVLIRASEPQGSLDLRPITGGTWLPVEPRIEVREQ